MVWFVSALTTVAWVAYCSQNPFFWDTILNSRIAHWYLETGFSSVFIPESLDAGHPPFFSLYLALGWKLLGRSLWVSHLMMLPLLLMVVWNYFQLARRYVQAKYLPWAMLLLFLEPTFLAQSSMMSADILLLAGFLLSLNAITGGRRGWLFLGLLLMAAVNVRGIYSCGLVFAMDAWLQWSKNRRFAWQSLPPYLVAGLVTAIWLWLHHRQVGWWLAPPPETYGAHRELLGLGGMARNIGIIGWRIADFGRVFLWAILLLAILLGIKGDWTEPRSSGETLKLVLVALLGLSLLFIPFSNPIGPRYYLIVFLLGNLLFLQFLQSFRYGKAQVATFLVAVIFLLSGHFWVYPDTIAKPWDGSLAHFPYFRLRSQMIEYVSSSGLNPSQIATDFPNIQGDRYSDLSDRADWAFETIEGKPLEACEYVMQSNIFNGFSDEELFALQKDWALVHEVKSWQVYIRLYRNPAKAQ
jgi:hypothetical protein